MVTPAIKIESHLVKDFVSLNKYTTVCKNKPDKVEQSAPVWVSDYENTYQNREEENRPKPTKPLWLHPTSYPYVTTLRRVWGIEEINWVNYVGPYCTMWTRGVQHGHQVYYYLKSEPGAIDWDTQWQLALRLKLKDMKVNLGASLAEFDQSVGMFKDLALGLHKAYRVLRRKDRRRKKFKYLDLPATVLQMNFGVMPLVADTFDTYMALKTATDNPIYKRIRCKAEKSDEVTSIVDGGREQTLKYKVSDAMIVYAKLKPGKAVTIGNPAEWLWERTAFSFVLDWALNIGDILTSLDALVGFEEIIGTRSRLTKYETTVGPRSSTIYGAPWIASRPCKVTQHSFERFVINENTIPQASLIPKFEMASSGKTLLNAVSLLAVVRGKRIMTRKEEARVLKYLRGF